MAAHVIKLEYENGEKLDSPLYWCGVSGSYQNWHFLDSQHLALAAGGSVSACESCVKAIIKELSREID